MSSLNYPISILVTKACKIALDDPISPEGMKESFDKLEAIQKAIAILKDEKRKEEEQEIKEKVKEIRKGIINE